MCKPSYPLGEYLLSNRLRLALGSRDRERRRGRSVRAKVRVGRGLVYKKIVTHQPSTQLPGPE